MAQLDGKKLTASVNGRRSEPEYGRPESVFDGINSHLNDLNVETLHGVHTATNGGDTSWLQVDMNSAEDVHEVRFVRFLFRRG